MRWMLGLLLVAVIGVTGCANHHNQFYKDAFDGDYTIHPNFELTSSPPRLLVTNNVKESARKLREEGYYLIGFASYWSSRDFSESDAIEFGTLKKVPIVLYYKNSLLSGKDFLVAHN